MQAFGFVKEKPQNSSFLMDNVKYFSIGFLASVP
jgi:hypothetical protein